MSTPMMHTEPKEIGIPENRSKYTVTIVGCNQTGILHAVLFAKAGFKTICADTDSVLISNIEKGKASAFKTEDENELKNQTKTGHLTAMDDVGKAVSQSDIVLLTVPAKIDSKGKPDYRNLETASKKIGQSLRRGSIMIVTETVGTNIIEDTIKEALENASGLKTGADFALAYSPYYSVHELTLETLTNEKRIVAAKDKNSLNSASAIIETITRGPILKTEKMKTAALAALIQAEKQAISIAVSNEIAILCQKAGVDYSEVHKLIQTDRNTAFSPSVLLDASTHKENCILLEDAENFNVKLRMAATARQVNEETVKNVIYLVKDALKSCEKTFRRARITVLGISPIPNAKAMPRKAARKIIRSLEAKGAKVTVFDPYFQQKELAERQVNPCKNLTEAFEGSDCAIILTGHDQFKRMNLNRLKVLMKKPAAIIDIEGTLDPEKVEKADLVYRGLGRGVWTK